MYSRITGYYRPVKNWNEGKIEEYKARKTYDPFHSKLKKSHAIVESAAEKSETGDGNAIYLFTTKTCPNCKVAKEFLKDVNYKDIDAEENPEMSDKYGIMQAPTLVMVKNGKVEKYVNASNIRKFVEQNQ